MQAVVASNLERKEAWHTVCTMSGKDPKQQHVMPVNFAPLPHTPQGIQYLQLIVAQADVHVRAIRLAQRMGVDCQGCAKDTSQKVIMLQCSLHLANVRKHACKFCHVYVAMVRSKSTSALHWHDKLIPLFIDQQKAMREYINFHECVEANKATQKPPCNNNTLTEDSPSWSWFVGALKEAMAFTKEIYSLIVTELASLSKEKR